MGIKEDIKTLKETKQEFVDYIKGIVKTSAEVIGDDNDATKTEKSLASYITNKLVQSYTEMTTEINNRIKILKDSDE